MPTTIREAGPADAALLTALARRTFTQTFAAYNTPENMAAYLDAALTHQQTARELAEEGAFWLLADTGAELAGFAKLRQATPPPALGQGQAMELQRLYVEQAWMGKGVGAQLMRHCLETARQQGNAVLWLGVWEHNPKAIAFYRQWGFETFGSHIFRLGDDPQTDLLMARNV